MKQYTNKELEAIREQSLLQDAMRPRASAVGYDASTGAVTLQLTSGIHIGIPARLIEGLQHATPIQLAAVEMDSHGYALNWEEPDVQMSVEGLLAGVFGSRRWMRQAMTEFARSGGKAKTPAKRTASRANGKLGGRPRKKVKVEH